MTAFKKLCFTLLLAGLIFTNGALCARPVSTLTTTSTASPKVFEKEPCKHEGDGEVTCIEEKNDETREKYNQLKKAVNFARHVLTNQSTLLYKERVVDLLDYRTEKFNEGLVYFVQLRLNDSRCMRDTPSCDPEFDPKYWPSNGVQTKIIAELRPLLTPGKEIEVNGLTHMKSERFHITIQTGDKSPVAGQLRFHAKLSGSKTVIQLEYFDGGWNLHSRAEGFIEPLQDFKIQFVCLHNKFEIYINRKLFSTFNHILPYQNATHLAIIGDVTNVRIRGVGNILRPGLYNPSVTWIDDDIQYQVPPYVPFVAPLAGTLEPGKRITIKGVIPINSVKFAITIQNGLEFEPENAPLRLIVGFPDDDDHVITLLHKDGRWKGEQIETQVLTRGHAFEVVITCLNSYFQVQIDGKDFARYVNTAPCSNATHLSVVGIVNITEVVGIKELPQVTFLDEPTVVPYRVRLENVTLTPGRKLKIWAYLSERFTRFDISFVSNQIGLFLGRLSIFPFEPSFVWNTFDGEVVTRKRYILPWLKRGKPIQIEIHILEKNYQIIFFGLWTFNFYHRLPLYTTSMLRFSEYDGSESVIYAVDASSTSHAPLLLSPPSRVCSLTLWHKGLEQDLWLMKNVLCTSRNSSSPILNVGSADIALKASSLRPSNPLLWKSDPGRMLRSRY